MVSTIVVPCSSCSRRTCSCRLARFCGSSPVDGSSRKSSARRVHQPDRDVEPAALAARQRRDRPPGVLGQVEGVEQLLGAGVRRGAGQPERAALADQLVAAALGVPGGVALSDVPDAAADLAVLAHHVVPGDLGGAGRRRDQRGQHPQRRRLAGAVRAEEGDELAGADLEVEAADRLDRLLVPGEVPGQSLRPDHRPAVSCWLLCRGHDPDARSDSGQFLSAIRSSLAP